MIREYRWWHEALDLIIKAFTGRPTHREIVVKAFKDAGLRPPTRGDIIGHPRQPEPDVVIPISEMTHRPLTASEIKEGERIERKVRLLRKIRHKNHTQKIADMTRWGWRGLWIIGMLIFIAIAIHVID